MRIDKIYEDWKQIGGGIISRRNGENIPTTMIDGELWTVIEKISDDLSDEVFLWLKEMKFPCIVVTSTNGFTKFWFVNEADATLFKMTW